LGKKKIQKGKGKEVGQKLELIEKFLRMRKLEERTILRKPQEENSLPHI